MTISRTDLSAEHAAISAIADRLVEAIESPVLNTTNVVRLRWRLSHALAVHLAKEDEHIYPELKRDADARLAHMATMFEREMGGLRDAYRRYMAAWDGERIMHDPAGFIAETRGLLALLTRRVQREEADLYPMYEQVRAARIKEGPPARADGPPAKALRNQRRS